MTKELICINCPMGCALTAEVENNEVISVKGNTCPRGEKYAKTELIAPVRTVTTTMMTDSGKPIPVKTQSPVPKEKIFDVVAAIKAQTARLPVSMGDVVLSDAAGTGVDIVCGRSML
ncbi:DUF1667 domain-containing protein [Ruminococcus sp. NK3A76]|uniref:DUF1667 domain-containing protein n=1 Tax=Ruminococcus sp. NK3A76 TaxID=877411 RepID=UPI0004908B14|nr:DUF1667 domain-containing protein [Ruminococcus sp. NK3A76]